MAQFELGSAYIVAFIHSFISILDNQSLLINLLTDVIEACPTAVHWPNNEGKTPIFKLSRDYESANTVEEVVYGQDWAISNLLLMAAQFGTCNVPPGRRFLVLHAAAMLPCPLSFLRVAASLFPHQIMEFDLDGMIPLARAAIAPLYEEPEMSAKVVNLGEGEPPFMAAASSIIQSNNSSAQSDSNAQASGGSSNTITKSSSISSVSASNKLTSSSKIELLLAANPNAVHVMNNHGRIPLNLSIASGKRWNQGTSTLYNAAPKTAEMKDAATGLYSFLLAASCPDPCVETCFHLLRGWPEVVRLGMDCEHDDSNRISSSSIRNKRDRCDDGETMSDDGDKKPRAI